MLKTFLFLIACAMGFSLSAKEQTPNPSGKKFNLSICTLFRNESKYLKEWIEYHRLVGVDHFYLYNNGSMDNFTEILTPYFKEGLITLIQWPDLVREQSEENAYKWALSTQVTAYENAVKIWAIKESKWLVFLDVEEFLVPAENSNLKQILEMYEDSPAVILTSDYFDASEVNVVTKRRLMIETLELTKPPEQNVQKAVTKTIFKPEECIRFSWPPFKYAFRDEREAVKMSRKTMRINHYTNRKKVPWRFSKVKDKMHVDNRVISEEETTYWLEAGYEIEDQERAIHRFMPELLKKIGYDPTGNW